MKPLTLLFIFFAFFHCFDCSNPSTFFLDLEEINSVQYDVKIGDQPIVLGVKEKEEDNPEALDKDDDFVIMPMTNKYGQKYHCLVPKIKEEKEEDAVKEATETNDAIEQNNLEKAKQVLEPMRTQSCLLRTKDWWTYEFCYGKQIRQYHMEDSRPTGQIMILGLYDHDEDLEPDDPDKKLHRRYHSQIYTNGSQCDLTGNARKTEVRFECDPSASMDSIGQVDEPKSCEYIITVITSKICAIAQLRPPPVRKPLKIDCQPVLTSSEYDKYQNYLKAKEKQAAKKAEEMKVKQRENLLKALDGEDISHIDVETDEGMTLIEGMLGEKLADKLMNELGAIFGDNKKKTKWINNGKEMIEIEEVKLASGEMQSKPKSNAFETLLKQVAKEQEKMKQKDENEDKKHVNLDPRSDLSSADEMMDELVEAVARKSKDGMKGLEGFKDSLKKDLEDAIEDIVEETADEMDWKMDGMERHQAIAELQDTLQEIMSKLDKAEADIGKVSEEIDQLHETIDDKEEVIDTLKKELKDDETEEKKDIKEPVDNDVDTKVNIKVTNFGSTSTTALKDSPSEKRVIKHLERAIKDKLSKAGLDTGGRQIEVKFITTSIPAEVFGGTDDVDDESMSNDEAKQFQGMIYNLMVGNQDAYEDIDNQRKTEKSYHFAVNEWSESIAEQMIEEELEKEQPSAVNDEENL